MVAGKHFLVHDGQVQVAEHTVNGEVLLEMWGLGGLAPALQRAGGSFAELTRRRGAAGSPAKCKPPVKALVGALSVRVVGEENNNLTWGWRLFYRSG